MSEKLDERGLQFARDAVKSAAAYNPMGDISTVADVAIRAYLQTAAAGLSELVEEIHGAEWWQRGDENGQVTVSIAPERVAEAYQTLSASNAALEAENERLREALSNMIGHAKWVAAEFDVHYAFLAECEAALSAPKGGQDHG